MKAPTVLLLLSLACASAPAAKEAPPAPVPAGKDPPAEEVGEEGGVEGGVAGGTHGSPLPGNAKFVPPTIGHAQRLVDPNDPRYKPTVRPEHYRGGSIYWGLFRVCVSDAGKVVEVTTLKSTGVPDVDGDWSETIKAWPHRPYTIDGRPVPFCYPLRLEVRMPKRKT